MKKYSTQKGTEQAAARRFVGIDLGKREEREEQSRGEYW
jgi:hypothetical protein